MCLFRKMEIEVHPSLGGHLGETEYVFYQEAKKDFLSRLNGSAKGKELVKNIFALVDQLTLEFLENNQIVCHRGCAWCCHQLVCCTTLEMELIKDYLNSLSRQPRRKIIQRVRKEAFWLDKLHQRIETNSPFGLPKRWELLAAPLREAHHGRPCYFLSSIQSCSIYPVRPIDCRIAKTKDSGCGRKEETLEERPEEIRLFFDQIASDLIMEEEERIYGAMQVVPLAAWSLTPNFSRFF